MTPSTRWLLIVAAAVAGVIALSFAVAALFDAEEEFAAGSVEAAVQDYLRAVRDGEPAVAIGFLSDDLREGCGVSELRSAYSFERNFTARVRDTTVRDQSTEVVVRITEGDRGSPFGGGGYSHNEFLILERLNGEWRFTEMPWPRFFCRPRPVTD